MIRCSLGSIPKTHSALFYIDLLSFVKMRCCFRWMSFFDNVWLFLQNACELGRDKRA